MSSATGSRPMVFGYARISTTEQDETFQLDALHAAGCDRLMTDRASGATAERPALAEMLDRLRAGDTVMVWRLDRLGRSLRHLIDVVRGLEERGVTLVSLTEQIDTGSPGGRLVFHVFGAMAEFERDLIRERTHAGLAAARARGRIGGRPTVWTDAKLTSARAMHAAGQDVSTIASTLGVSRASVYRALAPSGPRTPRDRPHPPGLGHPRPGLVAQGLHGRPERRERGRARRAHRHRAPGRLRRGGPRGDPCAAPRAHVTTSIQKRPNGKWRARYRDPTGKERSKHFDRKTDAQRYLDEMTTSLVTGQYVDPKAGRITLRNYYIEYAARQTWADTYVTAMDLAVRSAPFADTELRNIKRSTVEKWVKGMASDDLAQGTIKTRLSNVGSVLKAAKRDRIIAEDPSEGVTPPRGSRMNVDLHLPTPTDVGLLSDAAGESFKPYLALASFGGLRLGEISGLHIGDIDFLKRQILVRRQVQRSPSGRRASSVVVTPPKHGLSRAVPVPDALLAILSEYIRIHRPEATKRDWLFVTPNGDPPHQNTVGYWFRKAKKTAGVDRVTLHDLRHFYASGLIAAGCDVVTVQRALGHAKASTTLNTYAHLWPTGEERTRGAVEALMQDAAKAAADSSRTATAV
jgi:DNA invertase Pin-like site-specific DNA recombinase/integrase